MASCRLSCRKTSGAILRLSLSRKFDLMSTFEHADLIQNINESLTPFRKSQPDTMQAFGQLARSAMAEGEVSAKHKELIALAIGITQHLSLIHI